MEKRKREDDKLATEADRRREQRRQIKERVLITLLGPPWGPPIHGTIFDLSGSGLRILLSRPLPCGALVKLEGPHRLMMGEILRSDPEGDSFAIGVRVEQSIGLDRLNPKP